MPLPPPVTNARLPERSITATPPTRNAEVGTRNKWADFSSRVPRSAFALPRSCVQALLHHAANQMLDGEMNFLDPRRVVRGNDQHDVAQVFEPAARMPQEAHDRHPAGLREIGRASCRERVSISVVAVALKNKTGTNDCLVGVCK